mmetsp:Transcript_2422/g.4944  ORF Transcript_2422/g.4944 Transcript_2422/m.4944 type:complete len:87 (+) Transcript_2422:256-516(+)
MQSRRQRTGRSVSHALPSTPRLVALDLTAGVDDSPCAALAAGLACCSAIQELSLDENNISDSGVGALLPAFRQTTVVCPCLVSQTS